MNRQDRRRANHQVHGIVHTFEDPYITLKQLLKRNVRNYTEGSTKRSRDLWDMVVYDPQIREGNRRGNRLNRSIKFKSAFYVIQLPHCTKAIKIGKASSYNGDGIISRLNDHLVRYGNAKLLYLQTFDYLPDLPHQSQSEAVFEREVVAKLRVLMLNSIRGDEYFPIQSRDRIALGIDQVNEQMEARQAEEDARMMREEEEQRRIRELQVDYNNFRGNLRARNLNEL